MLKSIKSHCMLSTINLDSMQTKEDKESVWGHSLSGCNKITLVVLLDGLQTGTNMLLYEFIYMFMVFFTPFLFCFSTSSAVL